MDFKKKKELYARCQDETLDPDDERNLNIDQLPSLTRGLNWVNRLASPFELATKETRVFFTGVTGSGKSTELKRLKKRLEDPKRAHFFVVLIDAAEALDLMNTISVSDILAAMLWETEKALLLAEGKNQKDALKETYSARLLNWLLKTDIELKDAKFKIPGGSSLSIEMKGRPLLRERVRQTIEYHFLTFQKEMRENFRLLEGRVKDLGYARLMIIIDSMEKLRGITSNWEAVLESAERVFGGGAPHLDLPVHVLYTVPFIILKRLTTQVEKFPAVKLREKDGKACPEGMKTMRDLIRRRIPDALLPEVFGKEAEKVLAEIISQCGGHIREVVELLKWFIALPDLPAKPTDVKRALNEFSSRYSGVVNKEDYKWLADVARTKRLDVPKEAQLKAVERALKNDIVLIYNNGDEWCDLHPAVRDIPGIKKLLGT